MPNFKIERKPIPPGPLTATKLRILKIIHSFLKNEEIKNDENDLATYKNEAFLSLISMKNKL